MAARMVFQIILLLGSINPFVHAVRLAKDSCPEYCGDVRIPYPLIVIDLAKVLYLDSIDI